MCDDDTEDTLPSPLHGHVRPPQEDLPAKWAPNLVGPGCPLTTIVAVGNLRATGAGMVAFCFFTVQRHLMMYREVSDVPCYCVLIAGGG